MKIKRENLLLIIILILSLFVSEAFTAIAFDSGGVASGTMAAAFILPLCIGLD